MSPDAPLPVPAEMDSVIDEQWTALGKPGTWLDGSERLEVARLARRARATPPPTEPTARDDATMSVAGAAASISAPMVDGWEAGGLDRATYVEVVGVVSRVVAIDTFERGVGRSTRTLPDAEPGEPSRRSVEGVRRRAGWVPTRGSIGPPTALDSVRAEADAQERLHGALYLSYSDMADLEAERWLSRPQMELIAARVSFLNECRF